MQAMETHDATEEKYLLTFNKIDSLLSNRECRKVEIANLDTTVGELANSISELWKIDKSCFDIICFGNVLTESKKLSFYGITNGTLIYLINKKEPSLQLDEMNNEVGYEKSKYERCKAVMAALLNPMLRYDVPNLADFHRRENFLSSNPELRENPSILGAITDADLLKAFLDRANIKTVLKSCPNFLDVAMSISATFILEMRANAIVTSNLSYRGNAVNYSIDNDEDDDDDTDDNSDASSVGSITTNSTTRATANGYATLSSMLMSAYHRRNPNVITHDMLRNALNQTNANLAVPNATSGQPSASTSRSSLASTPLSGVSPSSSTSNVPVTTRAAAPVANTTANALINLAPQLAQMRELGITDEIVAIQALEATNGDVQAAINIIFSDVN